MMESRNNFKCACSKNSINLSFRNSMPLELVDMVFCPQCEENGFSTDKAWPIPGGWKLHFNLDVAKMFAMAKLKIDPKLVNPGFIIDGGYVE